MLLNLTMTQKNDSYRLRALIEDGFYSVVNGCPDRSYFIFEINVGKKRIRHRTTLKLNDDLRTIWIDSNRLKIQIQNRSISPHLSDIDFKNRMA